MLHASSVNTSKRWTASHSLPGPQPTYLCCLQLLRRLPKALYASLAGRIVIFLSNTLPLEERSGINVIGSFNSSHPLPLEDVAPVSTFQPESVHRGHERLLSTGCPMAPCFA